MQIDLYGIFANRFEGTVSQANLAFFNAFEACCYQTSRDVHIGYRTEQTAVYTGLLADLQCVATEFFSLA